MRDDKPATKKRLVGYGYVGVWSNGTLGWGMPRHLNTRLRKTRSLRRCPDKAKPDKWNQGAQTYLCEITVKPVTDSRGRFIVRRVAAVKP